MEQATRRLISRFGIALGEPSTWRGLTMVLAAAGIALQPEHLEILTAGGMFVSGLIGFLFKSQP